MQKCNFKRQTKMFDLSIKVTLYGQSIPQVPTIHLVYNMRYSTIYEKPTLETHGCLYVKCAETA